MAKKYKNQSINKSAQELDTNPNLVYILGSQGVYLHQHEKTAKAGIDQVYTQMRSILRKQKKELCKKLRQVRGILQQKELQLCGAANYNNIDDFLKNFKVLQRKNVEFLTYFNVMLEAKKIAQQFYQKLAINATYKQIDNDVKLRKEFESKLIDFKHSFVNFCSNRGGNQKVLPQVLSLLKEVPEFIAALERGENPKIPTIFYSQLGFAFEDIATDAIASVMKKDRQLMQFMFERIGGQELGSDLIAKVSNKNSHTKIEKNDSESNVGQLEFGLSLKFKLHKEGNELVPVIGNRVSPKTLDQYLLGGWNNAAIELDKKAMDLIMYGLTNEEQWYKQKHRISTLLYSFIALTIAPFVFLGDNWKAMKKEYVNTIPLFIADLNHIVPTTHVLSYLIDKSNDLAQFLNKTRTHIPKIQYSNFKSAQDFWKQKQRIVRLYTTYCDYIKDYRQLHDLLYSNAALLQPNIKPFSAEMDIIITNIKGVQNAF